jgi:predicted acyl esterase
MFNNKNTVLNSVLCCQYQVGANQWRRFNEWPPASATPSTIHFHAGGDLSLSEPAGSPDTAFDEYVSNPARPVPYIDKIAIGMTRPYMTDDQVRGRFAVCGSILTRLHWDRNCLLA